MGKYCDNLSHPEPIDCMSNCNTNMYIEEDIEFLPSSYVLRIASEIDLGIAGDVVVLTTTEINYCPYCGRKLKEN